jgi:hypothetical protein
MGRFEGFKKAMNDVIEAAAVYNMKKSTIASLMEMSEASGLKRIDVLVPRVEREGWMDDFLILLAEQMHAEANSAEDRRKAKTFSVYANDVRRNLA